MNKVRSMLAMALVIAVFAMAPQFAMAQATSQAPEIAKLIATAKTPEDHIKIAKFYEQQAKKAREKATELRTFSNCYMKKARERQLPQGRRECNLQVFQYQKIAQEDQNLAKMHLEIAKQLEKKQKK